VNTLPDAVNATPSMKATPEATTLNDLGDVLRKIRPL
jgi:hypothetical protein